MSIATLSGDIRAGWSGDFVAVVANGLQPDKASPTTISSEIRPGSEGMSAWKAGENRETTT
jgi:hypothetical protein